tara:strand:+ start:1469 stop:1762 length:294 start_codon:yes stop_codon:yes gene_type:complete
MISYDSIQTTDTNGNTVICANLQSAIAYREGRVPSRNTVVSETTVSVTAFVSPSGQYYVMHGNQRMDVANAQTARYYLNNGVPVSVMIAASLSSLNQ